MLRKTFPNLPKIKINHPRFNRLSITKNPLNKVKIASSDIDRIGQKPKKFNSTPEFDLLKSQDYIDQKELQREIQVLKKNKILKEKELDIIQKKRINREKREKFFRPFKTTGNVIFSIFKAIFLVFVFIFMVVQEIFLILTYFFKPRKYK
jgi:hypothetical protein